MSEAMQRRAGRTPAWLLFPGVAIGVGGASIRKHAGRVSEFIVALGSRTDSSDVAVAIRLGDWGLVLLITGAVLAFTGLVVIALADRGKRRTAQSILGLAAPERCDFARRGAIR